MRLPAKDSATWRALITGGQAVVGFVVGLVLVIWRVPGVPEAVISYLDSNIVGVLALVGIPAGLASFAWNYFRKDVKNY